MNPSFSCLPILACRTGVRWFCAALGFVALVLPAGAATDLWSLACQQTNVHRFSVYFELRDHSNYESNKVDEAIGWCRSNGVTKVYLESFRDDQTISRSVMATAKKRFMMAGLEVAGGMATTSVETNCPSSVKCYSEAEGQGRILGMSKFAAGLFDHVIMDDFFYTDCVCDMCVAPLQTRQFKIEHRTFSFAKETLGQLRGDLMFRVSQHLVVDAARAVNPAVKLTLKFPNWHDKYHARGYDVIRQTELFDQIWVGTETRNFDDCVDWIAGTPPYAGYFLMRWLGSIAGEKVGGGWFDWIHADPPTYLEQARQTILGGARETILFAYGGLHIQNDTNGCANPPVVYHPIESVAALRQNIPELLQVAAQVRSHKAVGIAAYKPANAGPTLTNETNVFSFVGMLGLPLAPCHLFPSDARAAFFSTHALKDAEFPGKLQTFIASGRPVLITEGLRASLASLQNIGSSNVFVLGMNTNAPNAAPLFPMDASQLDAIRKPLLRPFHVSFSAPARVGLYLFEPNSFVVENFNSTNVVVNLNGQTIPIAARGWVPMFAPAKPKSP
jgi:hypothetical protein